MVQFPQAILLLAFGALALLLLVMRSGGRGRRGAWDPSGQVAAVSARGVVWRRKPVLNRSEVAVFHATCRVIEELGRHWQVWPQVSLGEVLRTEGRSPSDTEAFRWINRKRCDLLIVDAIGMPLAALEYQGSGHYSGDAIARDAAKRTALERAGVFYIEVPASLARREGHLRAHLREQLLPLVVE